MKKLTAALLSLDCLLLGLVIGFLLSPVKNGLFIGNCNGSYDPSVLKR